MGTGDGIARILAREDGVRVIGVTGRKNSGKTGLVERLVAELVARGHDVATVKHAHHRAEVDTPGTDSFRHRMAGARQVALVSRERIGLFEELRGAPEPPLEVILSRLDAEIVLIEGYKGGDHPKIEAWRAECGQPPLLGHLWGLVAVAADAPLPVRPPDGVPVVHLDETERLADLALFHAAPA